MSTSTTQFRRVIGVFAHNEAEKIIACLESVKRSSRDGDICFVLNNGSTDNTKFLVEKYFKNSFCTLIEIDIGDKANAWNVFIHELQIEADVFYFLDGDCEIVYNALDALENCILENPNINAAAALPSKESSLKFRTQMIKERGLAGNLYALPKRFVERLREDNIRLPIGLIGDDSLVGALACWNLNPQGNWDKDKIFLCKEACFFYTRLSFTSVRDIRLYFRRKVRYSLRYFQTQLIAPLLKNDGLKSMPVKVEDLYQKHLSQVKIKWRGVDTIFDYLAARKIRSCVRNKFK